MIERGLAVFLVSLAPIGFLLGSFEGGRELLVAALVSAAIALVAVLMLRRGERRVEDGYFDERATRRAVRRGVIRTALAAVVPLFVLLALASIASNVWQTHGGRRERFERVAGFGFFAGHPGLRPTEVHEDLSRVNFRSLELPLEAVPRNATPLGETHVVTLRLDLRGRLDDDALFDLPPSGVDVALASPPATPVQLRALERLSQFAVASAAVELREPLSAADLQALLRRHRLLGAEGEGVGVFFEDADAAHSRIGSFVARRVGWPNPFVDEFQAWATRLSSRDDDVLRELGLPSSRELRALAANPRIHGFVLDAASSTGLRDLGEDPGVIRISLGDVAFAVGRSR